MGYKNNQLGYTATAPANGLIVAGQTGFGTSSPNANANMSLSTTGAYNLYLSGTQTTSDVNTIEAGIYAAPVLAQATASGTIAGTYLIPSFQAPAGGTSAAYGLYIYNTNSGNVNNISDIFGIYVSPGSTNSGTCSYSYGGYFATPLTTGTSSTMALYADTAVIGTGGTNNPPANGLLVQGNLTCNSNGLFARLGVVGAATYPLDIDIAGAYAIGAELYGTMTGQTGNTELGFSISATFAPSAQVSGALQIISLAPTITVPNASNPAIAYAAGIYISPTINGTAGKVMTNFYGILVGAGSLATASVTNAYGAYFTVPGFGGTSATALYADNLVIGSAAVGTSPSSSGAIIMGTVVLGSSTTSTTNALGVSTVISGTTGTLRGLSLTPNLYSSSGTVTATEAGYVSLNLASNAGTITSAYGLFIDAMANSAGTVTTGYGALIKSPAAGTNQTILNLGGTASVGAAGQYFSLFMGDTVSVTATSSATIANLYIDSTCSAASGQTLTAWYMARITGSVGTGTGTITTVYGLSIDGFGAGSGTTTNAYGAYIALPNFGTNIYGLQISSSSSTVASTGSIYGLFINPEIGCSSGTLSSAYMQYINPRYGVNAGTITDAYGLYIDSGATSGTITAGFSVYINMPAYGSSKYGIQINGSATVATGNNLIGLEVAPTLGCSSGTLAAAYAYYSYPNFSNNAATITAAYGMVIDSGATNGTITTGYGLYVFTPAYGTTKICAYFQGPVQMGAAATGATTAALGVTNCPCTTGTAPYVWMKFISSDGSTVYVPGWK